MLLVMLALAWWGSASESCDENWEQAVDEVCAVLRCTNISHTVAQRQKRDHESMDVGKVEVSRRSKRARK